jgi:hypothetical protein
MPVRVILVVILGAFLSPLAATISVPAVQAAGCDPNALNGATGEARGSVSLPDVPAEGFKLSLHCATLTPLQCSWHKPRGT